MRIKVLLEILRLRMGARRVAFYVVLYSLTISVAASVRFRVLFYTSTHRGYDRDIA